MSDTRIICSSDWHGDAITQGVNRFEEIEESVFASIRYARECSANLYVFCGDLTDPDNPRSHRAVALAHQAAGRLREFNIPSVWLPGNHDVVEDGSGSHTLMSLHHVSGRSMSEQTIVMDTPSWDVIGMLNLISLPFTPSSHSYDPAEFINSLPDINNNDLPILIIGHLNLEGITVGSETTDMPRGRDVFWPLEAIEKKFPNAILVGGHYHERQVYKGVHIVGSMARLTYGEGYNEVGYLELEI